MNEAVIPELTYLFSLLAAGAASFFLYDVLAAVRVILRMRVLTEKITDILYWSVASILVFYVIYRKNDGVIRGYAIVGMLCGMLLYRKAAGERIAQAAARVVKRIEERRKRAQRKAKKREKKELQKTRKQSTIRRRIKKKQHGQKREKRLKQHNEQREKE